MSGFVFPISSHVQNRRRTRSLFVGICGQIIETGIVGSGSLMAHWWSKQIWRPIGNLDSPDVSWEWFLFVACFHHSYGRLLLVNRACTNKSRVSSLWPEGCWSLCWDQLTSSCSLASACRSMGRGILLSLACDKRCSNPLKISFQRFCLNCCTGTCLELKMPHCRLRTWWANRTDTEETAIQGTN